jgi:hypothetical protein
VRRLLLPFAVLMLTVPLLAPRAAAGAVPAGAAVVVPAGAAPRPVAPRLTELPLDSSAPAPGVSVRTGNGGRVLRLFRAALPGYSAIGVTWLPAAAPDQPAAAGPAGDGAVRIVVRHRLGGAAWSGWAGMDPGDTEPDPSHRTARAGTDLVWVGASDAVEVRVTVAPAARLRDPRVTLVDPGRSPADTVSTPAAGGPAAAGPSVGGPAAGPAGAGRSGAGPAVAGAGRSAAVRPGIYTRAQWGADPRLMGWTPEYAPTIRAGFLHHTVDTNAYAAADVPAMLRAIYAYHSRTRGWGDIGYNFIVDRFGRIWEGRYGGVDSAVIGAHTGGFNYQTFGVSMLGTYSTAAVPPAVLDAVARLFAWKLAGHYRDPNGSTLLTSAGGGTSRYPRGVTVAKRVISGHRDVGRTACPGDRGYAALALLRAKVTAIMGTGLLAPAVAPATVGHLAAGPRLTAALWRPSSWTVTVTADCPAAVARRYTGTGTRIDVRWNLLDGAGRRVRPGGYRLTVQAAAAGRYAVPFVGAVTVLSPATAPPPPTGARPAAGPAGYVPIPPVRVLDTRGRPGGGVPLTSGGRVDVPVLGVGGVPASGVAAVALAVGGICPTARNWVQAWPAGTARPVGSVLPLATATAAGASSVIAVGAAGMISLAAVYPMTDVVAEVVGYFPLAGAGAVPTYHPVPPRRLLDTVAHPLGPGETRLVDVRALSGGAVPAGAAAVSVNLHAGPGRAGGVLRLWPADQPRPAGATLRYRAGWTQSARALPALSPAGTLLLRNDGPAAERVFLDLGGWFGADQAGGPAGTEITMVPRTRVADRRFGPSAIGTLPVTGVAGAPPAATGVLLQVTGLAGVPTYLTFSGTGRRTPAQDVDLLGDAWGSNLVLSPIGPAGRVSVFNGYGTTRVVVDVLGYLTPAGPG